ncbi:MAG: hypothetical protein ACQETL_00725 [Bacteroidota bacterium]
MDNTPTFAKRKSGLEGSRKRSGGGQALALAGSSIILPSPDGYRDCILFHQWKKYEASKEHLKNKNW